MPSPGRQAIADFIGNKTYTVEGGFDTKFNASGTFVQSLAMAMDTGWTSATPTTITTMQATFSNELNGYLSGNGLQVIMCIAQAIDTETASWANSWDAIQSVHTYTPTVASIIATTQGCAPIWSQGAQAITTAAAEAFINWFEQEAG